MKLRGNLTGYIFTLFMSPLIKQHDVFVIIPAYNEGAVILSVIEQFKLYNYKIVVVDDGSDEKLDNILHKLPVYLLRHVVNLGQGAALQTGIEFAMSQNAEYVVTFDADGQHNINDIEKLLLVLQQQNADVVLGSRFLIGSAHNMPSKRKLLLQFARRLNFVFTGLMLSDAHNGLRAMNRKAALSIQLTENRMAHATEILSQIKKNKLRYKEVPVSITYTNYSRKKGQTLASGFRIFFDLLLNKLFK